MLAGLSEKLTEGGYPGDTPAAIVYKATWPDEKIIRTTVAGLPEDGAKNDIGKTALILVGDFLSGAHERSFLYNPAFSHGFRESGNAGGGETTGVADYCDKSVHAKGGCADG
jgi:precorrin-4/cobalt-precorrin-4 C11-methyltransferase